MEFEDNMYEIEQEFSVLQKSIDLDLKNLKQEIKSILVRIRDLKKATDKAYDNKPNIYMFLYDQGVDPVIAESAQEYLSDWWASNVHFPIGKKKKGLKK